MWRAILRAVMIGGGVLVTLVLALLVVLRPPSPLKVPEQRVTLADVTIVYQSRVSA